MVVRTRLLGGLLVTALLLAGCGPRSNDKDEGLAQGPQADARAGYFGEAQEPEGTPRDTLNFGAFQEPTSLDPSKALGTGTSGGNELHAIYDTLLRYDPETLEYEPRLAESFEFNDDGTELTLTLREGVTFTDGTPLNAEAVIFSLQRHVTNKSRFGSAVGQATSMTAVDDHTVKLGFERPSYGYLGDLTNLPGTVVSPTAVKKLGAEFDKQPVGAGPYTVKNWTPGEELVLESNPDYWDGEPRTKTLRFVYLGSGEVTVDSLASKSIDMMMTREPVIAKRLLAEFRGFTEPTAMASIVFMNNRDGYATADPRIRKAIVHAIDPEVITDRAFEDAAIPSKSFVPAGGALHGADSSLAFDTEKAKELVEEAKADGDWNGAIKVMCDQSTQERKICQALEAMLNAAGFTTEVEYRRDRSVMVWNKREFEVAVTSQAMPDTDVSAMVWNNYGSTSPTNVTGYNNPELDAAAQELRGANSNEEKRAAMGNIQKALDEDPPVAMLATSATITAWNDNVTGVVPSGAYTVFLDKVVVTD